MQSSDNLYITKANFIQFRHQNIVDFYEFHPKVSVRRFRSWAGEPTGWSTRAERRARTGPTGPSRRSSKRTSKTHRASKPKSPTSPKLITPMSSASTKPSRMKSTSSSSPSKPASYAASAREGSCSTGWRNRETSRRSMRAPSSCRYSTPSTTATSRRWPTVI